MKRDKLIKVRANDYEKALVSLLVKKANEKSELEVLKESDVIRIAINDMANKYLTAADLNDLKNNFID